jgi:thymidylate synthase
LFRPDPDLVGQSPFDVTLDLLRADPHTKRAVLPIFGAHEVGAVQHPDVSCTIALQLLNRGGSLHAIYYMRANDAWAGLVSDVYSATFIQELAATLLGLNLGSYTHHVGSMHLADANVPRARAILADAEATSTDAVLDRPERMPVSTNLDTLAEVCAQEVLLRHNEIQHNPGTLAALNLDPYWQRRVALLEAYRQIKCLPADQVVDPDLFDFLDPLDQWLVRHRWPDRTWAAVAAAPPAGTSR